jgi:hypothetical protein
MKDAEPGIGYLIGTLNIIILTSVKSSSNSLLLISSHIEKSQVEFYCVVVGG